MFYVWQVIGFLIPVCSTILLCYLFDPELLKYIWSFASAERIMCIAGIVIVAMCWPHDQKKKKDDSL